MLFDEWRWNLEITEDLKKIFYDDPNTETDYNEFNYWKVTDNLKIDLDSGCLADSEDDCRAWTDYMFWQDGNDNWSIIHNLVNDVVVEDDDEDDQFFHNYWDENAANQSIIKSLLDDGDYDDDDDDMSEVANDEFIWEERETLVALIDFVDENENVVETEDNYLWNDPKVLFSLLETEDDFDNKPEDDVFLWEQPTFLKALLETEDDAVEENTENVGDFLWNNPDFARSLIDHDEDLITFSDDNDNDRTWTTWPFWNKIGSFQEIVEAYEICFADKEPNLNIPSINIEEVFWEICLDDSNSVDDGKERNEAANIPKDPVNIFKSIRHIFNVPKEVKKKNKKKSKLTIDENHLYDDMEDIYGEWAAIALDDNRAEKKRQSRGRKKSKNFDTNTTKIVGTRRTPTPTIQIKQTKYFDLDSCWIDSKKPNKERRTAFARNQKRLNAKMFAKQPRKIT